MAKELTAVPLTLRKANEFVSDNHRHNKAVRGAKFSIGAMHNGKLVGVAIAGRPIARRLDDGYTIEVNRTCILSDAPKGTNSFLYSRCWKAARAMGYRKIITYTLQSESGASLRGAGFTIAAEVDPTHNTWDKKRNRTAQPVFFEKKYRWEISRPVT